MCALSAPAQQGDEATARVRVAGGSRKTETPRGTLLAQFLLNPPQELFLRDEGDSGQ
jgi:hypothetical protein